MFSYMLALLLYYTVLHYRIYNTVLSHVGCAYVFTRICFIEWIIPLNDTHIFYTLIKLLSTSSASCCSLNVKLVYVYGSVSVCLHVACAVHCVHRFCGEIEIKQHKHLLMGWKGKNASEILLYHMFSAQKQSISIGKKKIQIKCFL